MTTNRTAIICEALQGPEEALQAGRAAGGPHGAGALALWLPAGKRPLRSGRRGVCQAQGAVFRLERNPRDDGHRAGRRDGRHSRCLGRGPARQAVAAVDLRGELLVRHRGAQEAEPRQGREGPGEGQRRDAVCAGLCHAERPGGHSIPVSKGAIDVLYAVGVISDAEADKGQVPGLERAIPKNKGVEFGSLLAAARRPILSLRPARAR